jgi:hypothetical protein
MNNAIGKFLRILLRRFRIYENIYNTLVQFNTTKNI